MAMTMQPIRAPGMMRVPRVTKPKAPVNAPSLLPQGAAPASMPQGTQMRAPVFSNDGTPAPRPEPVGRPASGLFSFARRLG